MPQVSNLSWLYSSLLCLLLCLILIFCLNYFNFTFIKKNYNSFYGKFNFFFLV